MPCLQSNDVCLFVCFPPFCLFWLNLLFDCSRLWFSSIREPGWNRSAVTSFPGEGVKCIVHSSNLYSFRTRAALTLFCFKVLNSVKIIVVHCLLCLSPHQNVWRKNLYFCNLSTVFMLEIFPHVRFIGTPAARRLLLL